MSFSAKKPISLTSSRLAYTANHPRGGMKIAFVHDYLKEIGGAERVLMALKEIWPEAPVYTAYAFPKYWKHQRALMETWDIRQSWGKWLPLKEKFLSYYTLISPLLFKTMDLSDFDVVIVSQTGGYFPNGVKIGPKTKLITYCHTPPRFLYGYPTATTARNKWYWKIQSQIANHFLRMTDFEFAQKPYAFIANSRNVVDRIQKFYRREATVVYPPIDTVDEKMGEYKKGHYYLMISRIVGSKNFEIAIEAAKKYGFNLKIAGRATGTYGKKIWESIQGYKNIKHFGEVDDNTRASLYTGALGVLVLEKEPDFGMVAVEPQMYGTPVLAYKNGGYLEAVEEGKTGHFITDLTAEGVWKGIGEMQKMKFKREDFEKKRKRFSKERFEQEMLQLVDNYAGTSRN